MNPYYRAFFGEYDWGWFKQRVPLLRVEDTKGITAIDLDANKTVAMVILDNWTQNGVQCHIAIDDPMVLRHGFLEECMDYVFNVCGKKKAWGLIPADNEKALKLNKHMGFVEVVRLKDGYADGVDSVIMEMTRETSKYIPEPAKLAANG